MKITYKESKETNLTFTPTETRLKIGTFLKDKEDTLIEFAEMVSTYLLSIDTSSSLRGRVSSVKWEQPDFYIALQNCNKKTLFVITLTNDILSVERKA